jgi:MoaE-MoaD fusion protein
MQVQVLYFGVLKDILHCDRETVTLPGEATVASLLEHYRTIAPEQMGLWNAVAIAVNQEFARRDQPLSENDEIAMLPPVSGGSGAEGQSTVALVTSPIDTAAHIEKIKQGKDGAVVVFDGIVRNHTRGRRTLHLFYESYEAMALDQMKKLAAEAKDRFKVREIVLIHRLGQLSVGETSVLVVVASAHRAQAFDACRWLIDTLKSSVPIWKKEVFEDGAVWVAGEPFPEGLISPSGAGAAKQ